MTREEQLRYEYETKLAVLKKEQNACTHSWGGLQGMIQKSKKSQRPTSMFSKEQIFGQQSQSGKKRKLTAGVEPARSVAKQNIPKNRQQK